MTDKLMATEACDGVQKDRVSKAAGVFIDAFLIAEGQPNAAAQRKASAERFQASLRVYSEAHKAALDLVNQAYPET